MKIHALADKVVSSLGDAARVRTRAAAAGTHSAALTFARR